MTRRILVLDVGGTNLKLYPPRAKESIAVPSGPRFTPRAMVAAVKRALDNRSYDAVSIGIPAAFVKGTMAADPPNLGPGWTTFDFEKALGKPVRLINDAAMQALGSYEGGTMLFLGLGTGLGTALVVDGKVVPMELGQLPYRKGTYEDYLGIRGYTRLGRRKWREHVAVVAARLKEALVADYVSIGGGHANALERMPKGCRRGDNSDARRGGQRLWD
jgi:predicted NBD/HSP70 family sugar kinase